MKLLNGAGKITVGLEPAAGRRWKVAFVSSTAIGSVPVKGSAKISVAQAWASAARSIGLRAGLLNVRSFTFARGWTNLRVGGLRDVQRVRFGAFGTARSAVPAFESIVLDTSGASTVAYRVIVNARTGAILARTNLTDYFSTAKSRAKQPLAVTTTPFEGEVPGTDAACDVRKGAFTVGPGVRALSGFAAATVSNNDIVFKLFFDGSTTPLITADTGTSPEAFRFAPAGGVPPGDYFVQVCDFADGAAWATPRTYTGTVTIDDSPALAAPVHAGEQPEPRLHLHLVERLEHAAVPAGLSRDARLELRRRGRDREPVRNAQPDARLLLLPRVHRAELQRAVRELRADRDLAGGRSADRRRPVGPPVGLT
jgi:hypothetical protein